MRLDLRREVSLTRQAVDSALRQGWGLGELPACGGGRARTPAAGHPARPVRPARRVSAYVDHATLDRLREHHAKLTTTCARIRADLLNDQVAHSATGINDMHGRTDLEIEARRRAPDPLDEIDELYSTHDGQPKTQPDDWTPGRRSVSTPPSPWSGCEGLRPHHGNPPGVACDVRRIRRGHDLDPVPAPFIR